MKTYIGKQVGWVRVNKPVVYTDRNYECAAWWEKRQSDTGVYPLILQTSNQYSKELSVVAKVPATVIDDYFPSLFGGVAIGNEPYKPKGIGQKSRDILVSSSLTKAILVTSYSPGNDIDWYINPELWKDYVSYLEGCMDSEYEYLTGVYKKDALNALSAIRYSSERVSSYAKDIEEVSRQIGYLNEPSDCWRKLHKANTSWTIGK